MGTQEKPTAMLALSIQDKVTSMLALPEKSFPSEMGDELISAPPFTSNTAQISTTAVSQKKKQMAFR